MFHNDLGLIDLGYWMWKESGEIPDPNTVAKMNQDWIDDLMNYDTLVAYERTMMRKRTG